MTDPFTAVPTDRDRTSPPSPRPGALTMLTWVVLVLSVVGNTVASFAGAPLVVHIGLGVLSAVCVAALTAAQLRSRR